jgi:hypothetical protein
MTSLDSRVLSLNYADNADRYEENADAEERHDTESPENNQHYG